MVKNILLYAHRGSTLLAPENTLLAFEMALGFGADVLEIDVRLSRDGQIVVIHDAMIDRTCNGHGKVCDLTLTQLKALDAAHHFTDLAGLSYRGQNIRLLSLTELFYQLPDTAINIDIKDNSAKAAYAVADAIEMAGRQHKVNVGSFHAQALAHFRRRLPTVTTAATQVEVAKLYFMRNHYRQPVFQYLQIPMRYKGIPLATKRFVAHAAQRGISSVFWTINHTTTMNYLIELGVNGIVTDRIDLAAQLVGREPGSV